MANAEQDRDWDDLAAEYVLGTLDAAERAEVERRLRSDARLAQAVAAWERRLDPLLEPSSPVAPPGTSFAVISARIDALRPAKPAPKGARGAEIIRLRRRVQTWRRAAIAVSAIAASLLVFIGVRELRPVPEARFVAVLAGDDRNPAFVAAVNVKDRAIMVMRLGEPLAPAPGHSHELWALGGGREAPQSLGLLSAASRIPADRLGQLDPSTLAATTFAISLEPEGGSPTGQPTGPVVFTGKLVPVPGK
jgi:anti-sigma-K factor RskA